MMDIGKLNTVYIYLTDVSVVIPLFRRSKAKMFNTNNSVNSYSFSSAWGIPPHLRNPFVVKYFDAKKEITYGPNLLNPRVTPPQKTIFKGGVNQMSDIFANPFRLRVLFKLDLFSLPPLSLLSHFRPRDHSLEHCFFFSWLKHVKIH
jgi:hypothetical protein